MSKAGNPVPTVVKSTIGLAVETGPYELIIETAMEDDPLAGGVMLAVIGNVAPRKARMWSPAADDPIALEIVSFGRFGVAPELASLPAGVLPADATKMHDLPTPSGTTDHPSGSRNVPLWAYAASANVIGAPPSL
jgi:hypothetical protein